MKSPYRSTMTKDELQAVTESLERFKKLCEEDNDILYREGLELFMEMFKPRRRPMAGLRVPYDSESDL